MPQDEFTVLLDKKEGHRSNDIEMGGKAFYKEGPTGVADSLDAITDAGLITVPTYRLIGGRAFAGEDDPAWNEYHDSRAERITALDKNEILGKKGAVYALDVQNGGLFVWNPQRIREAIEGNTLVNDALSLSQEEINDVLDAMKRNDYGGLNQIVHGDNVVFAGNYNAFLEASQDPNFLNGMNATYLVFRPADKARKQESHWQATDKQYDNPELVIASGGKEPLKKMLDKAKGFEWSNFGAWHDGYKNNNSGRVVVLNDNVNGVDGTIDLDRDGRSVGVAPEELDAFYKGKVTDPLAAKVNDAMK